VGEVGEENNVVKMLLYYQMELTVRNDEFKVYDPVKQMIGALSSDKSV